MHSIPTSLRARARSAAAILAAFVSAAVLAGPVPARADSPASLAELLIEASGDATFDNNRFDYDIIVQTVLALEGLGGDPDLGGATLLDVLSDPEAEVTVFVPRDSAFRRLARDLGWDGNGGDAGAFAVIAGAFDLATIRNVVKYHVVPGQYGVLGVLSTRTFETALPGTSFTRVGVRLRDNEPNLRDPLLTLPLELRAGEGIAHTISRVLIPVDL